MHHSPPPNESLVLSTPTHYHHVGVFLLDLVQPPGNDVPAAVHTMQTVFLFATVLLVVPKTQVFILFAEFLPAFLDGISSAL